MSINLKGKTELEQGNGRVQTSANRNGDGILVKENDSRINRSEEDVKDRSEDAVQVHQQQQSPQWSVVHWERFLHIKSIKVLLVENDDSTRHVVTALLRNLKYEVIVAANGLQAWKILEDLTNHIDIVLTEVVMPCLSGIGLLCKIMSHKTRKNIPVIMMSSHDAMGLVFKCLSKGAVDFLVKPVRKNELKNLWQHVWRRCHSSSGSGSESGTRTQKSIRSKSRLKSDNCSSSDDEDDNENTDLNIGAESDDDSSSQNSWAKEVDSSQAMSLWDQTAKFSDSTCAKLRSNVEIFNGKLVPVTAPKEFQERDEQNGNIWKGKSSVIGKRKGFELQLESPNEDHEKKLEIKNKVIDDSIKEPDIDLSLKRHRVFKDTRKAAQVDHGVLRRSDLSAFSRYNKTSDAFEPPNGVNRNNSLIVCLQIMKNKSVCDSKSCPSGALLYLRSDGVKVDKGSITDKLSINPSVVLKDKLEATPAINDLNLSSVFSPMKVDPNCPSQSVILVETDDLASTPVLAPLMGSAQEHPVQHIHHHHHVHHFHNIDGLRPLSNHDDLSLSIFTGPVEDNTANHSLTKSGSDRKNGSNGQIGSSTFVHAGRTNVENDVQGGAGSGNGYASGSGGGNKIDRNKSAFREAALTRFRQKKREQRLKEQRLGGVQVRYDDRKRLAERLRARGRFARQMGGDGSNTAANS